MDDWGLIPGRGREFFSSPLKRGSGAYPASYPIGIKAFYPRCKMAEV